LSSAINISTSTVANDAASWPTAGNTIVYSPFSMSGVFRTNGNSLMPVCGGMRLIPTGVMTGSSGLAFGGIEPTNNGSVSLFANTAPSTILSNEFSANTFPLAQGIRVLWKPEDSSNYSYDNNGSVINTGSSPGTLLPGAFVGLLGGQSAQTVFVETIYHIQMTCLPNVACMFAETEDGLTTEQVDLVYRRVTEMVPRAALAGANSNTGLSVANRLAHTRSSVRHQSSSSSSSAGAAFATEMVREDNSIAHSIINNASAATQWVRVARDASGIISALM